jgi:Thioredoxin like C-terminal domain
MRVTCIRSWDRDPWQADPVSRHHLRGGSGREHGADVDAGGQGVVTSQRLYQLVRQSGTISDRTFEICYSREVGAAK